MKKIALSLLFLGSLLTAGSANDTLATADSLAASGLLTGYSIERRGDNDYFRVVIPSAGDFTVGSEGTTDTYGFLLNSAGTQLAANDDANGSLNFSIARRLTAGTYHVRVRHYSSTGMGAYQLRTRFVPVVTDDHGNTAATATALTLSGTTATSRAGNFERGGDVDYFRVTVPGSGFLNLGTTGSTDTFGFLHNSADTAVASNDDANGSLNFAIRHAVTAGTYYIKTRHYSASATGAYALNVRFEPASTFPPVVTGNRALVVGISDYRTISDLTYCDDDARDVAAALRTAGWNVTSLVDSQATKAAIRDHIARLAPGGGKFLIYFSGHGSAAGTTGYLCNWDASTLASMISDTELNTWLGAAGTTSVGAVIDSCFSGSFIARSSHVTGLKTRFYQVPGAPPADPRAGEFLARNISTGNRVALTACAGSQLSVESSTWGHGWFTWRLLSIWRSSAADVNRNSWISIEESFTPVAGGYNYGSGRQDPKLYDGNGAAHFDLTRW